MATLSGRFMLDIGLVAVGGVLLVAGVYFWVESELSLEGLWAYKNTFGRHPLHISVIGILVMGYGVVDFLLGKEPRRKR